jgi:hypothetical protein
MKVFLSWSGNRSREVANFLSDWLCCVIQATRPWVSTRDLDRGSLWFGEINDQLKDTSVGIVCLTNENKDRPWILFEAGALAKGLSTARVCTFLIDVETKDIEDPLAQFNHTFPARESVLGLVKTLNSTLGISALDTRTLEQVFETYWPQFETKFKEIISSTQASASPSKARPKEDVLGEILETSRMLNSRLRRLEHEVERGALRRTEWDVGTVKSLREVVREMRFVRGMPLEMIAEELRHRAPLPVIRDLLSELNDGERPVVNS